MSSHVDLLCCDLSSPQISLQLFDARAELHKVTCRYTVDLNTLHAKKTPDFLNRVVTTHLHSLLTTPPFSLCAYLSSSLMCDPTSITPTILPQVDFMMSHLSYFHLGHVTVKDTEPHITAVYGLVEVWPT